MAYNSMINLPNSVIYGKETRTKDMEPFIASIEAAGKGGLTVVEYNFYAHRAIEGYYETVGRAKRVTRASITNSNCWSTRTARGAADLPR